MLSASGTLLREIRGRAGAHAVRLESTSGWKRRCLRRSCSSGLRSRELRAFSLQRERWSVAAGNDGSSPSGSFGGARSFSRARQDSIPESQRAKCAYGQQETPLRRYVGADPLCVLRFHPGTSGSHWRACCGTGAGARDATGNRPAASHALDSGIRGDGREPDRDAERVMN